MKAILQDIIIHTHQLGMPMIKVTGDDDETKILAISTDRSMVMFATTHTPYPSMRGVFGMSQLNKLKYLLDCPEYRDNATIEIIKETRNDTVSPVRISFSNASGDFSNDYGLMNSAVIDSKIKNPKFNGAEWNVSIKPKDVSVQRFSFQSSADSDGSFVAKTVDNNLVFVFGSASGHSGEFTFEENIEGTLKHGVSYPVAPILGILKLADPNTTVMKLSDAGVMQITLDSGMAVYNYLIPGR